MKVLVTGCAGLIGSHLCEVLLARGDEVIGIDNFNDYYPPQIKRRNIESFRGHVRELDIRDAAGIDKLIGEFKPTAIAHLAAMANVRYSIGRAALYHDVNVTGSINLLEAALKHDCHQFVFASTSSAYGDTKTLPFIETDPSNTPLAPYPASKKAVEMFGHSYHNLHQMNFTALRFFSVYGPRARPDMMPFMVTDRIVRGQKITLFNAGNMKRDWTYVDDIVAGVVAAIDKPCGYEIINLGRGEPVLMSDFVTIIEQLVGKKAILETPPAPASEPPVTFADISKARRLLGYNPQTAVQQGLEKLWAWYQATHIA